MTNLLHAGPATADPFTAIRPGERHRAYAELAAAGPVRRVELPDGSHAWLVLTRDAARAALTDARLVKTTNAAGLLGLRQAPEAYASIRNHLLLRDGTEHTRMRRLVGAAFTARRVQALEPRIRTIAGGSSTRWRAHGRSTSSRRTPSRCR